MNGTPEFVFALLRARGMSKEDAFANIRNRLEAADKKKGAAAYEQRPQVQEWVELFGAADLPADEMRRELVALYLADSRNEHLPISSRHRARENLTKLFDLDRQRITISSDEEFRNFLLDNANRKGSMSQ